MSLPFARHSAAFVCLACAPAAFAEETPDTECPARRRYSNMRYEEDWRFLANPRCATDPWDRVKYIDAGDGRHLTLGGELRLRWERFANPGFGRDREDRDGYGLSRGLFHGRLAWNENLSVFGQLESSDVAGRRAGPRATDRDRLDVNQLFVQWTPYRDGRDQLTLRAGRQEVELGASQFTSARDGLNDRQSFDGVRLTGEVDGWRLHAMGARVVTTKHGVFDDNSRPDETLSGFFVARSHDLLPGGNAVFFSNRRTRPESFYADGTAREERISIATRWWSTGTDTWDYNWEAGVQRGSLGSGAIRAWFVSIDNGRTLPDVAMRPRLGLRFNIGSGDSRAGDGVVGTFSPLFAATAYSGLAGLVGPSNSVALAPSLRLQPDEKHTITAGVIGFWRQSLRDGTYNIFSEVQRMPGSSEARHVGTQSTLMYVYAPTPHVTVVLVAAYFQAGRFMRETPPGENVVYLTGWWTYRF